MEITTSKIAAFIVAIILVVISLVRYGAPGAISTVLYLLAPLAMISFPEEIGSMRGRGIDKDTPGIAVTAMGWLLLLAVGILVFLKGNKITPW